MKKQLKTTALALGFAALIAAAPVSQAHADRGWHGGGGWRGGGYHHGGGYRNGALFGGLLAGSLVTAALLDRPHYYYGPGYRYYPQPVYYEPAPVYYAPPPAYYYGY